MERAESLRDYLNSKGMAKASNLASEGSNKVSKKRKDLTPYEEQLRDSLQSKENEMQLPSFQKKI